MKKLLDLFLALVCAIGVFLCFAGTIIFIMTIDSRFLDDPGKFSFPLYWIGVGIAGIILIILSFYLERRLGYYQKPVQLSRGDLLGLLFSLVVTAATVSFQHSLYLLGSIFVLALILLFWATQNPKFRSVISGNNYVDISRSQQKEIRQRVEREFPESKALQDMHYYRYLEEIRWDKMTEPETVADNNKGARRSVAK